MSLKPNNRANNASGYSKKLLKQKKEVNFKKKMKD